MQHRINLIAAATLWSLSLAPAQAQADVAPADPSLRDKTLVTWVAPANLEQRGGSALTLDAGQGRFDGVVFGEMTPRKWMPGSEGALRTLREQANWPDETADGKTFVQMAIAYQDRQVTIYRNGRQYAQYVMNNPPLEHGAQSAVLMGMRHITQGDNVRFAGAIDDARIYDRALSAEQIAALKPNVASDIKPWAWWTFDDKEAKDRTGRFKAVKLAGGAKVEDGKLVLDGKNASLFAKASIEDSIRFRTAVGNLGDTIPFYNGQYHVFYLTGVKTSWEHIVSTDLVHWKELPTALIGDGAADGPDGQNMFTGCVVEKDGVFHLYYTGWNPRNPQGREWIMHATSTDLVKWTKHPEHGFRADGVQYFNRDFRDPYVFWNDQDKTWWMILNTTDAKTDVAGVGRLRSEDLIHWKQLPPLVLDPPLPVGETGTPECPDLFRSGDYWYLLYTRGVQNIRRSKDILGPYRPCEPFALDGRILCGKRMFDGKRHLYVAPLGDGVMCQPRELYAGPEGQLFQRPVAEVTAFFTKTLHQFDKARDVAEGFVLPTPGNCMLECSVQMDPQAELTITLRQQSDGGDFRTFVLRPKSQDVEFGGPGGREGRRCPLDASKPIKFQAFVQDATIECFVNDQYGFTFGSQNYPKCALGFKVEGGKAKVLELKVKTHSPPARDKAEVLGAVSAPAEVASQRADILIADFEGKDYGEWKVTGEAFGPGPAQGTLPNQQPVTGFLGKGLVNSFNGGDKPVGTLTSPEFKIERKFINFLIGGGDHKNETCINLLIEGRIVRTETGQNNEKLELSSWDVVEFAGKQAVLQIVDKHKGGWGHIAVDEIVHTDIEMLAMMSMEYKCPSVNKRFMHIPISSGARSVWVSISVDGVWQRELSIALAGNKPDFYATLEVGQWQGKRLTLTAEKVYSHSQWSKLIKLSDDMWDDDTVYTEKYRPQFHFTVRHGGIGDPNGLVYFGGEYHLFGQHRAFQGENSGGMESTVWAHAIGSDPFHWVEYPIAVLPDKLGVPFSGSGVVDWKNTAGLVKNPVKDKNGRLENPAIVIFYTSEPTRTRNGGNTSQSMAYSLDSGRTWITYPGNPVVPYIVRENRDPKVFWYEDKKTPGNPNSGRWIMALYLSGPDYALLASKDLIHWEQTGGISNIGCVECPDMFELPVDGNPQNTRWVFWGGNGNHVIGTFDGRTFTKESGPFSTHAGNEYAAQTFSEIPEKDGRRIQLANLYGDGVPGMTFKNQLTIPRVLALRTTPEGIRLFIEPAKEIERLRTAEWLQITRTLAGVDAPLTGEKNLGELVDAEAVFEIQSDALSREGANVFGMKINGQTVICDLDKKQLKVRDVVAPLSAVDNKIKLRVILDRMSIEVFANDGAFRIAKAFVPEDGMKPNIQVFGKKGLAYVNLRAYQLQSIWKKK
jgi:fructan beta-fructosidase